MPILDKWDIQLNTDQVLRAQGADPAILRARRPNLIEMTDKALKVGQALIQPQVLFEEYCVKSLTHERLELFPKNSETGKFHLSGQLIAQHFARVESIIVMACTIGCDLETTVSSLFPVDPLMALALDGVGSAAVVTLSSLASNYIENKVKSNGLKTTIPLNPGMIGWPVNLGQPQIFALLDYESIHVSLTESWMMIPSKSLSLVIGVGTDVTMTGSSCEYCSLKEVCKYKNHHEQKH